MSWYVTLPMTKLSFPAFTGSYVFCIAPMDLLWAWSTPVSPHLPPGGPVWSATFHEGPTTGSYHSRGASHKLEIGCGLPVRLPEDLTETFHRWAMLVVYNFPGGMCPLLCLWENCRPSSEILKYTGQGSDFSSSVTAGISAVSTSFAHYAINLCLIFPVLCLIFWTFSILLMLPN